MESNVIWSEAGSKGGSDYAHSQHFVKNDGSTLSQRTILRLIDYVNAH